MESITIKVEPALLKAIERVMKPYYSTKTEFIREAIRKKIDEIETEHAIKKLHTMRGFVKQHTTDVEMRRTREIVSREFDKKFGL